MMDRKTRSATVPKPDGPESKVANFPEMVWLPGGIFWMGSNQHYPEEAKAHRVRVDAFWMDRAPVTNKEFENFVEATHYKTFAER